MAIRKIARMGHPVLREQARELSMSEIGSPEVRRLIDDMIETMHEYSGIGLAAPQIHEPIQLAIIEFEDENPRYGKTGGQALQVFINPKITVIDATEQGFWEGCLSVPDLRGLVYRARKIQVDYLDQDGKPQTKVAEGFLATVFQHELDHLAGTLFIDRVRNEPGKTPLAFLEEYSRYCSPDEDDEIGEMED